MRGERGSHCLGNGGFGVGWGGCIAANGHVICCGFGGNAISVHGRAASLSLDSFIYHQLAGSVEPQESQDSFNSSNMRCPIIYIFH